MIGILLVMNNPDIPCQDALTFKELRNSVYMDCATAVFIGSYSVNYERVIVNSNHYKLNINAGFGGWYYWSVDFGYRGGSIPLSLNNLIGSGNNYFETDLGLRYTFMSKLSDKERFRYFPIVNFGYRYQRPDGEGLIARLFIGFSGFGIGFGKAF